MASNESNSLFMEQVAAQSTITERSTNTAKKNLEKYGILISSSLSVNNKPLIDTLDRILALFREYLILIAKVNRFSVA